MFETLISQYIFSIIIIGVYTWWPSVTEALFNYEGTAVAICVGTGSCKYDLKQVLTYFLKIRAFGLGLKIYSA